MPQINIIALEKMMRRRNMLFKHQLSNLVGVSYTKLGEIMSGSDSEIDEQTLGQLCDGLGCERSELIHEET
jgi:DNA-binding Xre family transcriptional regulator